MKDRMNLRVIAPFLLLLTVGCQGAPLSGDSPIPVSEQGLKSPAKSEAASKAREVNTIPGTSQGDLAAAGFSDAWMDYGLFGADVFEAACLWFRSQPEPVSSSAALWDSDLLLFQPVGSDDTRLPWKSYSQMQEPATPGVYWITDATGIRFRLVGSDFLDVTQDHQPGQYQWTAVEDGVAQRANTYAVKGSAVALGQAGSAVAADTSYEEGVLLYWQMRVQSRLSHYMQSASAFPASFDHILVEQGVGLIPSTMPHPDSWDAVRYGDSACFLVAMNSAVGTIELIRHTPEQPLGGFRMEYQQQGQFSQRPTITPIRQYPTLPPGDIVGAWVVPNLP